MKKKLSLLMVLMMMISLVPANMAFATSDSVVNTAVTSADATVDFDLDIEIKGAGVTSGGIFEITLGDDAEWATAPTATGGATLQNAATVVTEQRAEYKIDANATSGNIKVFGTVKLDGAKDGDQKVTIENVTNSGISRQVVTYAVVSGSGTIISRRLGDVTTVTRGTKDASDFELRETTKDAMNNGTFVLRLPKDVEWVVGAGNGNTTVELNGAVLATAVSTDKRELTVTVAGINDSVIDRIIVSPVINMTKDAKFGDIDVEVMDKTADIDADDVKIAEYKDFGIALTVDKVESIVAGKADTNKDYVVEVKLETAGNSFIAGRPIDFTVAGGDVKLKGSQPTNTTFDNIVGDYDDEFEINLANAYSTGNDLKFELYLKADWDAAGELKITAKGAGVEEQTIKLADVLSAAKITTKVDANRAVADVVVGLQNQVAPEITITETEAGSLQEGYYVFDLNQSRYSGVDFIDSTVKFETTGDISVDDVYTIEDGEKVVVYVDGESNKEASSIIIKGLTVTLDRAVPFGQLDLRFGAVVADGAQTNPNAADGEFGLDPEEKGFDYDVETIVEKVPFLNVVTEVQTAKQQKTVFTLDSATYTVGSETKTLDAAPYISNNRTMLPIGTVAQLAGATLNYSSSTRTAIFTKDNLVVSMNLDTNMLLVNGSPVPMDAKPEIVNGRAFVPVVYVAQAFGIQNGTDIVYDAATRTVTLFPDAQ